MSKVKLLSAFQKRRLRIRRKIAGSAVRPRLVATFSGKHIYAQCIDDKAGRTLVYLCTLSKEVRGKLKIDVAGASKFGSLLGDQAKAKGIEKVVFDRAGRRYHGRVKAFADAVRNSGISF